MKLKSNAPARVERSVVDYAPMAVRVPGFGGEMFGKTLVVVGRELMFVDKTADFAVRISGFVLTHKGLRASCQEFLRAIAAAPEDSVSRARELLDCPALAIFSSVSGIDPIADMGDQHVVALAHAVAAAKSRDGDELLAECYIENGIFESMVVHAESGKRMAGCLVRLNEVVTNE